MKIQFSSIFILFLLGQIHAQTIGILENSQESFNGYTLFAPNSGKTSYLIDNCGNQINSWTSDFPPAASAYLLKDGSLLRTARINGLFGAGGAGGRVELFDWEGNLSWAYDYSNNIVRQHHDIQYLENGNVLMLAWRLFTEEEAQQLGRITSGEIWSEEIIELEPIGSDSANIVWKWSALDHTIQDFDNTLDNFGVINHHPERWNINYAPEGGPDWLHFNSISYNSDYDQIILSSKHLSEIYVIDHSTTTEEATTGAGGNYGKGGDILYRWGNPQAYNSGTPNDRFLFGQHDAHWIPSGIPDEGKIMIYNNGEDRPDGDYSTVDIIEPFVLDDGSFPIPATGSFLPESLYSSHGSSIDNFYSAILSGAQRLANGNILICEGREGHIFEINSNEEIVWEYTNPTNGNIFFSQGEIANGNDLFRAYRYPYEYPAFDNRDLTPGLPIELNPINQDCTIFEEEMVSNKDITEEDIFLKQNPIKNQLTLENPSGSLIDIVVHDISGKILTKTSSSQALVILDSTNWQKGLYIIHLMQKESNRFSNFKVLKF